MPNPNLSIKDIRLIKASINRVFSRSDLRKKILDNSIIQHEDLTRPRVKTWCLCNSCKQPQAKSSIEIDHIEPKVPLASIADELSIEQHINATWCDENNLQALCKTCHDIKSARENKIRRENKKLRRQNHG